MITTQGMRQTPARGRTACPAKPGARAIALVLALLTVACTGQPTIYARRAPTPQQPQRSIRVAQTPRPAEDLSQKEKEDLFKKFVDWQKQNRSGE